MVLPVVGPAPNMRFIRRTASSAVLLRLFSTTRCSNSPWQTAIHLLEVGPTIFEQTVVLKYEINVFRILY